MTNNLNFIPGKQYCVIKPFIDYDHYQHTIGETWKFVTTNFLPYDDGLTLHVIKDGVAVVYRLQWRKEQQADIIENFHQFVTLC